MTRRVLLWTLPAGSLTAAPPSPRHRIRFDGIGRLRIGLGEAQLQRQLGAALRIETRGSAVYAGWGDPHLGLLLVEGRLVRIDVAGGRWQTLGGGRVGSLELEIRAIFRNRVEVMPHGYDPRGRVLVVGGRAPYALAFETDGDVVTALRAGVRETLLG
ncbi:MAG: hypothetical protein ACK6DY_12135 [Acidobacteriota bacterium]